MRELLKTVRRGLDRQDSTTTGLRLTLAADTDLLQEHGPEGKDAMSKDRNSGLKRQSTGRARKVIGSVLFLLIATLLLAMAQATSASLAIPGIGIGTLTPTTPAPTRAYLQVKAEITMVPSPVTVGPTPSHNPKLAAPGCSSPQWDLDSGGGVSLHCWNNVYVVSVDLRNPEVEIRPAEVYRPNPLSSIADADTIAVINGDYSDAGCSGTRCAQGLFYISGNDQTNRDSFVAMPSVESKPDNCWVHYGWQPSTDCSYQWSG